MQVAVHIGAHATDEGRLLKSLFRNQGVLARQGVLLPGPGRYRRLLLDTLRRLDGAPGERPLERDIRELLLDTICDGDTPRRVILSHENFICFPGQVLDDGILYAATSERIMGLGNLFAGERLEFFLALRNPASFLPALAQRLAVSEGKRGRRRAQDLLRGGDPRDLSWSDMVRRIREASPAAGLTVWCNEDTPLIWERVMRALGDVAPQTALCGADDLLHAVLGREGMKRLRAYLAARPGIDAQARVRVLGAFIGHYAEAEARNENNEEPVSPEWSGWDARLVRQLSELYEVECDEIAEMEGVRFIAP